LWHLSWMKLILTNDTCHKHAMSLCSVSHFLIVIPNVVMLSVVVPLNPAIKEDLKVQFILRHCLWQIRPIFILMKCVLQLKGGAPTMIPKGVARQISTFFYRFLLPRINLIKLFCVTYALMCCAIKAKSNICRRGCVRCKLFFFNCKNNADSTTNYKMRLLSRGRFLSTLT